jgi:hypothetical protein
MKAETTKRGYGLRMTEKFVHYDINGTHVWREFPKGSIISDPDTIRFLESVRAPVERIDA